MDGHRHLRYALRPDQGVVPHRPQVVVLGYLAQGRDIEGIAREMGYAPSTIKKEVHLTIKQCRARNRAHAVAIAIRAGII